MSVRAKFVVDEVLEYKGNGETNYTIRLSPVGPGTDPKSENSKFFKYTPSGRIELGTVNPAVSDQMKKGQEFYVDFSPVS